jgi:hypothetical protein
MSLNDIAREEGSVYIKEGGDDRLMPSTMVEVGAEIAIPPQIITDTVALCNNLRVTGDKAKVIISATIPTASKVLVDTIASMVLKA